MNPRIVSVIMPAFNAAATIRSAIESVLAQAWRELELIVVDDGSTDETAQIVSEIAARDSRVHLLKQANSGVAAARNNGIREARGEFIAPIDADDICFPRPRWRDHRWLSNLGSGRRSVSRSALSQFHR